MLSISYYLIRALLHFQFTTDYAAVCVSAFTPSTDPAMKNTWVLGGAFLSQFYTIYNIEKKTIGIVRTPN